MILIIIFFDDAGNNGDDYSGDDGHDSVNVDKDDGVNVDDNGDSFVFYR